MLFPIFKLILPKNVSSRWLFFSNTQCAHEKTASIIVIGDEVLKGFVVDTNSHFISKILYRLGVSTRKIVILGDTVDNLANEIREHSSKYNYVITTGGIGPTHDDVTFEAAAKAFNEDLVLNPVLDTICTDFFKKAQVESKHLKMAQIPRSARLTFGVDIVNGKALTYPNVSIRNVFMFPGVPQFMEKSFSGLSQNLFTSSNKFFLRIVYVSVPEYMIVSELNLVVREFPTVMFGSYPEMDNEKFKVRITIESTKECTLDKAHTRLINLLPSHTVVEHNPNR